VEYVVIRYLYWMGAWTVRFVAGVEATGFLGGWKIDGVMDGVSLIVLMLLPCYELL